MKLVSVFLTLVLSATVSHAANVQCVANSETQKGSGQFDKLVFAEKIDEAQGLIVFLKPNGTTIRNTGGASVYPSQVSDGDTGIYISFPNGKVQLATAKVKTDQVKIFEMTSMVLASSGDGKKLTLLSNGLAIVCSCFEH